MFGSINWWLYWTLRLVWNVAGFLAFLAIIALACLCGALGG